MRVKGSAVPFAIARHSSALSRYSLAFLKLSPWTQGRITHQSRVGCRDGEIRLRYRTTFQAEVSALLQFGIFERCKLIQREGQLIVFGRQEKKDFAEFRVA